MRCALNSHSSCFTGPGRFGSDDISADGEGGASGESQRALSACSAVSLSTGSFLSKASRNILAESVTLVAGKVKLWTARRVGVV